MSSSISEDSDGGLLLEPENARTDLSGDACSGVGDDGGCAGNRP